MATVTAAEAKAWGNYDGNDADVEAVIDAVDAVLTVTHLIPYPAPASVKLAVLMQVARLWKRRNTPEGVAQWGDMALRVNRFDPDIDSMLSPYQRFEVA